MSVNLGDRYHVAGLGDVLEVYMIDGDDVELISDESGGVLTTTIEGVELMLARRAWVPEVTA